MICYTIGHSTRKLEEFIEIIKRYGIDCIMDVRENPYANNDYSKAFDREILEEKVKQSGVNYIYMGKELGSKKYELNLDMVIEDELFKKGIRKIVEGIKRGHNIALLCSERNPFNCHRSILLGYALKNNGVKMEHIIDEDNSKTQRRIEEEIFITYEPVLKEELIQLTLQDVLDNDDYDMISEKELKEKIIEEGYRRRFRSFENSLGSGEILKGSLEVKELEKCKIKNA